MPFAELDPLQGLDPLQIDLEMVMDILQMKFEFEDGVLLGIDF